MSAVLIAEVTDLKPGEKKKIVVGSKIILLADVEGQVSAVDNTCTHMGGDLRLGVLEGKTIICPKHHAGFDVTSGKNVKDGKLLFIPAKAHDLNAYPITIEGNQILIDL